MKSRRIEVVRRKAPGCTGRVDQQVDCADLGFDSIDQRRRCLRIGQVGRHRDDRQAFGDQLVTGGGQSGGIAGDQDHPGARGRELAGTGQPDTAAGTGDDGKAIVEADLHGRFSG